MSLKTPVVLIKSYGFQDTNKGRTIICFNDGSHHTLAEAASKPIQHATIFTHWTSCATLYLPSANYDHSLAKSCLTSHKSSIHRQCSSICSNRGRYGGSGGWFGVDGPHAVEEKVDLGLVKPQSSSHKTQFRAGLNMTEAFGSVASILWRLWMHKRALEWVGLINLVSKQGLPEWRANLARPCGQGNIYQNGINLLIKQVFHYTTKHVSMLVG